MTVIVVCIGVRVIFVPVVIPMLHYGILVLRQGKQSWRATLLFVF